MDEHDVVPGRPSPPADERDRAGEPVGGPSPLTAMAAPAPIPVANRPMPRIKGSTREPETLLKRDHRVVPAMQWFALDSAMRLLRLPRDLLEIPYA